MGNYIGSKYEATEKLDLAEIAKLVRADIKVAVAAGELPKGKYSVRIERYSMGQALHVNLSETGKSWCNPERVIAYRTEGAPIYEAFTDEYRQVLAKMEAIVNAYNYDKSDSQSDYYNSRFHDNVRIGDADQERQRIFEEYDAAPRPLLFVLADLPKLPEPEQHPPLDCDWFAKLPE